MATCGLFALGGIDSSRLNSTRALLSFVLTEAVLNTALGLLSVCMSCSFPREKNLSEVQIVVVCMLSCPGFAVVHTRWFVCDTGRA